MEELVRRAQNGDSDALVVLISQMKAKLYRTAYFYLKSEEAALEAVAETTSRAYLSIGKLRNGKYFSTWLTRIIINYCLDELKYTSRLSNSDQMDFEQILILDEDSGIEARLDLMSALRVINPKYRDVIILKYFEDISVEDIAVAMNKPIGTIKTWINRGLKQLRQNLKGSENYV